MKTMHEYLKLVEDQKNLIPFDDEINYYMVEGCGIFAYSLSKFIPNSTIKIICRNDGEKWSRSIPFECTHVFLSTPAGKSIDAKGPRTTHEMIADFNIGPNDWTLQWGTPEVFKNKFLGNHDSKPLYGSAKDINQAVDFIKKYRNFYLGHVNTKRI